MSWLSSVNNLLENLDGQAETVAETVAEQASSTGISNNLRRLNNTIAINASALTSNIANSGSNTESNRKTDSFDDDDDNSVSSFEDFDDDDDDFDEELTTDEDDYGADGTNLNSAGEDLDLDEGGNDNTIDDPKEIAAAPANPPTESLQPTNNIPPPDKPVSDEACDGDQPKPGDVESTAASPTAQITETEKPEKVHSAPSKTIEMLSGHSNISDITTPENQQIPALPKIPNEQQIPKESTDEKNQKRSASPKVIRNVHIEKTLHSSNKNDNTAVDKKVQENIPVPNQPPPPQQKVGPKSRSVVPASIPNSNPTKNQSGKKVQVQQLKQKQKQQKDETKLFKKQQHQHQQVLALKNKTIQSLESQLVKLREDLTNGAAEHENFNQRMKDLVEKLQSSEGEIEAQANELVKAGEVMEQIRTNAKEEKEDLLDDHEDEKEDIQRNHQEALDKMRQDYERTIAEWKQRYESEESLRQQEGGDSIMELQGANKREREALIKLAEVSEERTALQAKLDTVMGHETTLKQQVESSLESAETVAAREQRARDELDEAAALHTKQMAQRQRREAELEQTILEMGSALTRTQQQLQEQQGGLLSPKGKATVIPSDSNQQQIDGSYFKEQFEQVAEELESVNVRFTMETQRREALQQELTEVSKEREQELSMVQSRQRQQDRKVADLESTIHRLQASLRVAQQQPNQSGESIGRGDDDSSNAQAPDNNNTQHQTLPNQESEKRARQEIANLSEQLLRQQGLAKNAKSEIMALKGRLQAANARADDAETARYDSKHASQPPRSRGYDVEGGANSTAPAFSARRRVKGGSSSRGVRSIRSALPCLGSGRASGETGAATHQLALTIDAIDSWMVNTGSFMRHEPYARLGLLLYLAILHLWSFALVVFHTTEVPHGDFGSMDSSPRHWREHT